VTCNSLFIYDAERQRSLQHFIQIENLPSIFSRVTLPSGTASYTGTVKVQPFTQVQVQIENLPSIFSRVTLPSGTASYTGTVKVQPSTQVQVQIENLPAYSAGSPYLQVHPAAPIHSRYSQLNRYRYRLRI
jgi:hypothetical protein